MKFILDECQDLFNPVTPLAGVWIEIVNTRCFICSCCVTPLAGVWIEIGFSVVDILTLLSLPSRECGLKFVEAQDIQLAIQVTPLAGVWIEIFCVNSAGLHSQSLPSRECGLKY